MLRFLSPALLWLLVSLAPTTDIFAQRKTRSQIGTMINSELPDASSGRQIKSTNIRTVTGALADLIYFAMDTRGPLNPRDVGATPNDGLPDDLYVQKMLDSASAVFPNRSIYLPEGYYNINTGLFLRNASNVQFYGPGVLVPGGSVTALKLVNCFQVTVDAHIIGAGTSKTASGIELATSAYIKVSGQFRKLNRAIFSSTAMLIGPAGGSFLESCYVDECNRGMDFRDGAEYVTISQSVIYRCTDVGVYITAGNISVINNIISECRVGVWVLGLDGSAGNSDHGNLTGNKINHNHQCGVFIQNTTYSFNISTNQIWATNGANGINAGFLGYESSYGLFALNCENLNVTGNTIAHNRTNMGVDGLITSTVTANTFKTDPTLTVSNYREVGATQSSTNTNAQNTYYANTFYGLCTSNRAANFDFLTDTRSSAYRVSGNVSNALPSVVVLSGSSPATYYYTMQQAMTIQSNFTGSVEISAVCQQNELSFYYDQLIPGATKDVLVKGTVTSVTDFASVSATASGNVVTLSGRGRYVLTPVGASAWVIACQPATQFLQTPVLLNGWAPLSAGISQPRFWKDGNGMVHLQGLVQSGAVGSVIYKLPVDCRPTETKFLILNATEQFGSLQISPNGDVKLSAAPSGFSWVSTDGLSFRRFGLEGPLAVVLLSIYLAQLRRSRITRKLARHAR